MVISDYKTLNTYLKEERYKVWPPGEYPDSRNVTTWWLLWHYWDVKLRNNNKVLWVARAMMESIVVYFWATVCDIDAKLNQHGECLVNVYALSIYLYTVRWWQASIPPCCYRKLWLRRSHQAMCTLSHMCTQLYCLVLYRSLWRYCVQRKVGHRRPPLKNVKYENTGKDGALQNTSEVWKYRGKGITDQLCKR